VDVMFFEAFKEEELLIRKVLPSEILAGFTYKTIQAANLQTPPSTCVSIRTQSIIPKEWAYQLQGILTRSTGYDHLLAYCQDLSMRVPCGYLPDYCARAVAEQVILMVLALMRRWKQQILQFDTFCRDDITGQECLDKRLLVCGVGRIGTQVVGLARGLQMDVKGVDVIERLKDLSYVGLEEGIQWAQVVVCALPLTCQTQGLFNYQLLRQLTTGSLFVNISRGEVAVFNDLNRLLEEGILGGLAMDVFENEAFLAERLRTGEGVEDPFVQQVVAMKNRHNVIFTPHNAFNTQESLARKVQQSVHAIKVFLQKREFPNPVPQI
jgi:D-lactate dehydrogenase